ncbi:DUF4013 domain-containing protein [Blastopirellula retiformator]|uniref:DUF4013 domain-containing protein n=1 Tax=Blastopirellula retiformator TaxID=2527970 RepID=A0A5C5UZ33_9BACT|nr:DUF4013 domain-containing protein [Blastopirellula retiformator]TWT30747.1 hypothetical protein Enr8_42720 [Blastopirellula retiformator]
MATISESIEAVSHDDDLVESLPAVVRGAVAAAPPIRGWFRFAFESVYGGVEWLFGLVSIVVLLAILATIPIANMLSLGYLLEVSGRIARTGKFSEGFIGIRKAARLGSIALGTWLLFWPLRFLADLRDSANLIEPGGPVPQRMTVVLVALTLAISFHIAWAWFRGGKFRHFLWPAPLRLYRRVRAGGMFGEARDNCLAFLSSLRLGYYFSLGVRGFFTTLLWLILPVSWMIAARGIQNPPAAFLVSLPGMLAFCFVLLYLPFMQAHFAAENRWRAMFEWREVRKQFKNAPLAFWSALLITLLFALPLYLLKIELIDREIAWLPSLFFVALMLPARLLSGWALGRARRRGTPRNFFFRWVARLGEIPVVALYVFFMYLALYVSWSGAYSLLEQHAFLVPAPFVGG